MGPSKKADMALMKDRVPYPLFDYSLAYLCKRDIMLRNCPSKARTG